MYVNIRLHNRCEEGENVKKREMERQREREREREREARERHSETCFMNVIFV